MTHHKVLMRMLEIERKEAGERFIKTFHGKYHDNAYLNLIKIIEQNKKIIEQNNLTQLTKSHPLLGYKIIIKHMEVPC